ncbi:hypothetical protein MTR67_005915 [Solanum verrucosum]|uniref:Uncharacterized protein n=1 Tax=Solanum verrucosum TaxID=315347 RepID=A0AAF0PZA4_SOLVR|nr:hypothetical protein MTR67_005915 [Solanum verrucosum]
MEKKKMNAVAAMAIVLMILLSSNTVRVAAQGVDCYDSCNTACVGLPSREYQRCDEKCRIRCGPDRKIDTNLG